jgi:hypothetical protein
MKKRKIILIAVLLVLVSVITEARKKAKTEGLCEIKNVFVIGNSESASILRREIENRTWMTLVNSEEKADAIFEVSESRSTKRFPIATEQTTISGSITKRGTKELLWSDSASFGEGVINSGAGSAVKILLGNLRRDAGCKK